jgi:electron-transferring-flavoprotein dehydrogenase
VTVRASDYPPPFNARDYVSEPTDPTDERIEVGILIVGAGPAGLACAVRLGQLLEEHPDAAERLGDVPVAVVEKGKQPGSHLLSGAVVNPRALRRLFKDRYRLDELPSYGEVPGEAVYVLTKRGSLRIPPPPTMRNHGNWIFSLSQLGRWLAERAEEGGAMVLPETAAEKLLVSHGRVVGIRTGDKGRNKEGEPAGNFEPGSDLVAKVTVLAEGTQGHLTGVALDHFGLRGDQPQVWELGVKEIWRVPKPLRAIVHTMGWPLRTSARYREFGGSFIYPMGDDMLTIGMVVGLDYRDVELSAHDLLQELKTHPKIAKLLDGGERVAWGAKTIPSGGYYALPRQLHAPGVLFCGDGAGLVNIPRLKGIHYAIESGRLAAESAFAALQRGATPATALSAYDNAVRKSFRPLRGARQAASLRPRLLHRRGARERHDRVEGPARPREAACRAGRGAATSPDEPPCAVSDPGREAHVRQALLGVPLRQQDARRPAKPHPNRSARAEGGRGALGEHVPCAGL